MEAVGDCVYALAEWRDALARALDEGAHSAHSIHSM